MVPIPNNLQLDPRYAALHMAIAEVGHVPMFDGEHMVREQGLHDVPLATWRECKRRRLDHIVSYVGGGCSLGRALESGG